ncbi:MAG: hypothetical protein A2Z96_06075 [Spirochaetes bacterium GWB1_48_6]|nr:MAG: hypothetical protein A2Z96_06075 [Spirochaetes bacterium GWB1_48_6]
MNRKVLIFMALSLPLFVFLNVAQSYDYEKRNREVKAMEAQQREWVEKNKQVIAGISVLSSPERISKLAENDLDLELIPSQSVIKVNVDPKLGDN